MKRPRLAFLLAAAIAAVDLLPLWLVAKQALTSDRETFAWPPTWFPQALTLEQFGRLGGAGELVGGLLMSLSVAVLTVISTLALTVPAAWLAARHSTVDRALDVTVFVARVLPPLALAVPLAVLFVRVGLYNHPAGLGLWLAHTLTAIPFAFFTLRDGFRQLPPQIEEAAILDGASVATVFWRIHLPLVRPALAAAALLVFVVSWDEFAFALLLQVTHRPLPTLVYYYSAFGFPGLASAVALVLLLPAVLIMIILEPALRAGSLAGSGR